MGAVLSYFKQPSRVDVLFEPAEQVWMSYYADGVLDKHYKPWKYRHFEIRPDGSLIYSRDRNQEDTLFRSKTVLHISKCHFALIKFDFESDNFYIGDRICIKIECKRDNENGIITFLRILLPRVELYEMLEVIKLHSKDNNVDKFKLILDQEVESRTMADRGNLNTLAKRRGTAMTRDAARWIDNREKINLKELIHSRRGAFTWLPIAFSNDLVHGSWWYLFGSFLYFIVSLVVYNNTFHPDLGQDDSVLDTIEFRATWILLLISGVFFTLGSFAFMRACTDPPMKPLLQSWKHFCVDDLLGAWFFFFGVLPAIPYAIIWWSVTKESIWIGLTLAAIGASAVTYFFVLACYPTVNGHAGRSTKCLEYLIKAVGKRPFVMKNFATDWLVAVWFIYWGTLFFTVITFAYMLYSIDQGENRILIFVNVAGFIDTFFFLIGAAYFVAGSFSQGQDEEFLDDEDAIDDDSAHPSRVVSGRKPTTDRPDNTTAASGGTNYNSNNSNAFADESGAVSTTTTQSLSSGQYEPPPSNEVSNPMTAAK